MKKFIFQFAIGLMLATTLPKLALAQDAAPSSGPVDKRIEELHTKLNITKDQETLWAPVAKEMQDSAKTFGDAIGEREKGAKAMTAIDDLKSYAAIAEMHAQSMHKFLVAFTPLYTAMSADQKKNADTVFREHKNGKTRSAGKK